MENIKRIIQEHRHWHPAWTLAAIKYYIETGEMNYNPYKEKQSCSTSTQP